MTQEEREKRDRIFSRTSRIDKYMCAILPAVIPTTSARGEPPASQGDLRAILYTRKLAELCVSLDDTTDHLEHDFEPMGGQSSWLCSRCRMRSQGFGSAGRELDFLSWCAEDRRGQCEFQDETREYVCRNTAIKGCTRCAEHASTP